MKEQQEPTGEMLSVTTLKYESLVWDFHQEMKRIGIGAYSQPLILHDSLICTASLIQSTLQCFDRTLLVEIVSKVSSNVTFSYSTNYMNEKCVLPMHQKFEAVYCNFCSIIKPEPFSWTGEFSFAFLWVIHLQTSVLFWCIAMIGWRVHVIYHDSQHCWTLRIERLSQLFFWCALVMHHQLMETGNVLLQNDSTQKRKSPEVQTLYNEAFKVWTGLQTPGTRCW